MTKEFLPEYSQMPYGSRYRPLFRLFAGENWRFVRKDGQPVECDTAIQAIAAAKECLTRVLNPSIRSEQIEQAPAMDALADEVTAFLARREQEAEQEKVRVFGDVGPSMIYPGRGRPPVAVEHRQRRRA
ncbi:MAG TPA: hypothetical protein VNS34_10570 [Rhizobiaceae bacterium]|nr:hypothetical protein [Rhizobiaceae bacterium]